MRRISVSLWPVHEKTVELKKLPTLSERQYLYLFCGRILSFQITGEEGSICYQHCEII